MTASPLGRAALVLIGLLIVAGTRAQQTSGPQLALEGDIVGIHDPVIIRERDTYYVFSTNSDAPPATIRIRSSPDLVHWTKRGHVFDKLPDWATTLIPARAAHGRRTSRR